MSTFVYRNYTLNGYRNPGYYTTEIDLFKAILDLLPQSGTTSVTTEHHHARLASPDADATAVSVSESGIVSLPLLAGARGVVVADASGNIGVTVGVFGYIESPGAGRILYGGATGLAGSANFTYGASSGQVYVSASNPLLWLAGTSTSAIQMGSVTGQNLVGTWDSVAGTMSFSVCGYVPVVLDGTDGDVYMTKMVTWSPSVTGIDALGSTGTNCQYTKLGRMVDAFIYVGGQTGVDYTVRISLPVAADATVHDSRFRWVMQTNEAGTRKVGTAMLDTGATGIIVFADGGESGIQGWFGSAGTRTVSGHIRYYAA